MSAPSRCSNPARRRQRTACPASRAQIGAPSWPSRNCRKGLAMIKDKDLWNVEGLETRFTSSPMPLTGAIAVIGGRKGFRINRVRTCPCCGEIAWDNGRRSEESRAGKECVRRCGYRWVRDHSKKKKG